MENKKLLSVSIIILAVSLIFSSIWIGNSLEKTSELEVPISTSVDSKTLTLSQVADYLKMTEEEVLDIIKTENKKLEETNIFRGKMFPYFIINNKRFFYKDEIDEWLKEVSSNHREYNTIEGWIYGIY